MIKPTLKSWDSRRDLLICNTSQDLIAYSAIHFASIVKEAVAARGACFIALSGGSTPKAIFQELTTKPHLSPTEWSKLHLFWSDERSVPPSDPESNYHMAMEAGLKKVPIPPQQIHRMQAECSIESHALEYEQLIQKLLGSDPFDLMMLGMGEDGHTASLFPHTSALCAKDRLVVANYISTKKTWRMTMTLPCIHRARNIAIYALGTSKKDAFAKAFLLEPPFEEIPVAYVGTAHHPALWIIDSALATALPL